MQAQQGFDREWQLARRRDRHLAERFALRKGSTVRAPRALFASALARSLFVSRELSSFYRTLVVSRFPQKATLGAAHVPF
jgi:hypothetical protein